MQRMIGWQAAYAAGRELERRNQWAAASTIYSRAIQLGQQNNDKLHYRLSHVEFQLEHVAEAIDHISKAMELTPGNSVWHYKRGFYLERDKDFKKALEDYETAISLDSSVASWHYRSYSCHAALKNRLAAENSLKIAISLDPDNARYHQLLTASLRQSGPRWQELEALKAGLNLHSDDPKWLLRMAESAAFLGRPEESASYYAKLNKLSPENSQHYYEEGYQWELANNSTAANISYNLAKASDESGTYKKLGIGAYHQKAEQWSYAAKEYALEIGDHSTNADLWYRYGFSLDRLSNWTEASSAYRQAVILNPTNAYWQYKLGFALEKSLQWEEAASAYLGAAALKDGKSYWYYRAGYCLEELGQYDIACEAYQLGSPIAAINEVHESDGLPTSILISNHQQMILDGSLAGALPIRSVELLKEHAELALQHGRWSSASTLLNRVVMNADIHDPKQYYRLGQSLVMSGDTKTAARAFRHSRMFMTPDGINIPRYEKSTNLKNSSHFSEYMETLPLQENTILWESNHGASIGCHPLAIFRSLLNDPNFKNYNHIWAISNENAIPSDVTNLSNVIFTQVHSDQYKRILATAKYVVNNVSFPPYYVRRDGQQYLNTWHGTPFKTLGKDMAGPILQHANLARNFLQSTHIMSPNEHTSWALINRHDIEGIFSGRIEVTGSPRLDRAISTRINLRQLLRKRLGISEQDSRPVVLFAPTWRGSTTDRTLDTESLIEDVKAMTGDGHHLIFRAHRLTENLIRGTQVSATPVPADVDTSDLLAAVDLLITDYSSISFDFLPFEKPIIYYTPDFDEYSVERGLYLDKAEMPGTFCNTRAELLQAVRSALSEEISNLGEYSDGRQRFSPMEDGNASKRVIEFFFNTSEKILSTKERDKKTLLFHQSLIPNGIATSFRNLVNSLDPNDYDIFLVIEPEVISADPARLEQFHQLPDYIKVIGRIGTYSLRPSERYVTEIFNKKYKLDSDEQRQDYTAGFQREFRRIFGNHAFDASIEFDGYSPTWCSLMSCGSSALSKLVYLHNELIQEMRMKYPDLAAVFRLYEYFDKYVSVSKELSKLNAAEISANFPTRVENFDYCNNQIDPHKVLLKSEVELDYDISKWYNGATVNFISVGRLSPEKDHSKLVRAFAKFHELNADSNLLIIGDGPLAENLDAEIRYLGAEDYIWLAGPRNNPYPAMKSAHAFVLSSLHEGQPMVLFEAMILNTAIICTDMPGPRGVLENGLGTIVENSEAGLLGGLVANVSEIVDVEKFDATSYKDEALNKFLKLALSSNKN